MDARIIRCAKSQSQLAVQTDAGCVATSWQVRGQEILALPVALADFLKSQKTGGIPLLYPYANRLRADHFTAADKAVELSRESNLKRDSNGFPMHGLLIRWADWIVTQPAQDELHASIVWGDHAQLFAAYPFAHTLRVRWKLGQSPDQPSNQITNPSTYAQGTSMTDESLIASTLTVTTIIAADKGQDVPVSFGWHPYLALHDRVNTQLHLPARRVITLEQNGLPAVGATSTTWLPACAQSALAPMDDLFQLNTRDESPVASIVAPRQRLQMTLTSGYSHMQVYSPKGANFVCVEPMTAATNALCDGAAVVKSGNTFSARFDLRVL